MQEIASRMKVDASRVSQVHAAAPVRLKAGVASLLRSTHTEAQNLALARWQRGLGPNLIHLCVSMKWQVWGVAFVDAPRPLG